jgi:hypothetical protein
MTKIAVVTTFHENGLKTYAQNMINSFCENWPKEVKLHIYPEKCNPIIRDHSHVTLTDLDSVQELTAFKQRWQSVPKANGWCNDSTQKFQDKTQKVGFKWEDRKSTRLNSSHVAIISKSRMPASA